MEDILGGKTGVGGRGPGWEVYKRGVIKVLAQGRVLARELK
jgi:hypothetical protein